MWDELSAQVLHQQLLITVILYSVLFCWKKTNKQKTVKGISGAVGSCICEGNGGSAKKKKKGEQRSFESSKQLCKCKKKNII